MAETQTGGIRIQVVAKELNVSFSHLIEHLNKNGFKVENKPTIKITEEMHALLLRDFQQDKENKKQADKVSLGIKALPKEEEKAVTPVSKKVREELPDEVLIKNIPSQAPATEKKKAKENVEAVVKEEAKEKTAEAKVVKPKKPTLAGPKIVGTIKLEEEHTESKEQKETEKKKTTKKGKKKEDTAEEVKPEVESKAEIKVETEAPAIESLPVTKGEKKSEEPAKPEVRKTEYEKLTGPTIKGKIDLGTVQSKKPDYSDIIKDDRKRKRKRIYTSEQQQPERSSTDEKPKVFEKGKRPDGPPRTGEHFKRRDRHDRDKGKRGDEKQVPQEVSEKEIQDKIKQTLARLGQTTKGKSAKAKYRKLKREDAAEGAEATEGVKEVLQVTEFISVSELANLLGVPVTDVIKNCMNLGVIVSINQRLDAEIIELVANEFGQQVEFISAEEQEVFEEEEEDNPEDLLPRSPIVTIMGHVDHGKTSLLDRIRQTNVIAGEMGGITQHIGAYEVTLKDNRKITFLDTPGHEAFTAMRARGAKITDIAVIVIAADDSVMPQTKEAISHAQAAGVPMIFAFNKMDKPGANADKVREQLAQMNLLVEEWGGKFQSQEISAKQGLNIDLLLDKILLEAELLELKANPNKPAIGSVIEASLDKGKGYVSTVLVQEGTLRMGDMIVAGANYGKVKAMFNERGTRMKEAPPSTPVLVLGLDGAPQAGEKFRAMDNEQEAKQIAYKRAQIIREQGIRTKKHITLDEIGRRLALGNFKELNVIVKADFDGSVEAVTDSLEKLSTAEVQVNIVYKAVGQISESDVLLASASDAIILGFQVRPSAGARKLAEKENIEIRTYSIIYNAIEEIKAAMEGLLEPKVEERAVCQIEVREVFKITKVGTVAGCYVTEGKINRSTKVHIVRDGIVIYTGEILALKRFKDDVKEVSAGMECGISIRNYNDLKVGDVFEGFEEVEVKRTL